MKWIVTAQKGGKVYYLANVAKGGGYTLNSTLAKARKFARMDAAKSIALAASREHPDFKWGFMPLGPQAVKRNPRKRRASGAFHPSNPKIDLFDARGAYLASTNFSPTIREAIADWNARHPDRPASKGSRDNRRRNPVPASKRAAAAKLYKDFSGHDAIGGRSMKLRVPDTGLQVGKIDGIMYSTVRDGRPEKYVHRFKRSARPLLAASHDGRTLVIVGGRYQFTDRGIVDR